ncbi:MFS transporter [Microbulbifer sp. THAF38]|uniref:MFS transporter n=1 Tax=Microbulbifer sp. THAF38 TaxID=2587856 RepID=UPI001267DDE5|nr:MFS transporter [Microbulbifer sp. THAF38]QFT53576.1 Bifunctional protein Aas [Microbulbifer sp. THAF38]
MAQNQFKLLGTRRFLPLFITQVLAVFSDNLYKNALIVLLVFRMTEEEANTLINIATSLYILPYFLFSASAGQLADKIDKSKLIRIYKMAEIGIGLVGIVALFTRHYALSLAVIFCYGTYAALFSAAKFSLIPQQLNRIELLGGNALIQMGSFIGTLAGTIVGTLLVGFTHPGQHGLTYIAIILICVALSGYLASCAIPKAPAPSPKLHINWNPVVHAIRVMYSAWQIPSVFYSILAIAWFWLITTAYLAQIPNFTRAVLGGSEEVITLLLCSLTVGTALGSLLCNWLSRGRIEPGLIPLGAIGITCTGMALGFHSSHFHTLTNADLTQFFNSQGSFLILLYIALFGVFGGIFTVPLYAMIQDRSSAEIRAQIIAISNMLNSLFIVAATLLSITFLDILQISIPKYFVIIALLNLVVVSLIFAKLPEFIMRVLLLLPARTLYKVNFKGLDQIPNEGPALIVSNHISFLDPVILADIVERYVRFVAHPAIFKSRLLRCILHMSDAIPIGLDLDDPNSRERTYKAIEESLENGELLCIFPEGKISEDGELQPFLKDIEEILRRKSVPVIPIALHGADAQAENTAQQPKKKRKRRLFPEVLVIAGQPVESINTDSESLQKRMRDLKKNKENN